MDKKQGEKCIFECKSMFYSRGNMVASMVIGDLRNLTNWKFDELFWDEHSLNTASNEFPFLAHPKT